MKESFVPSRKVREEFLLTYELKGAQRAIDSLTKHYGIRRMKIIVDGRRVGDGYEACYYKHAAYFKKRGLNKHNVLHELYHHIAEVNELNMTERIEERCADRYARDFL